MVIAGELEAPERLGSSYRQHRDADRERECDLRLLPGRSWSLLPGLGLARGLEEPQAGVDPLG